MAGEEEEEEEQSVCNSAGVRSFRSFKGKKGLVAKEIKETLPARTIDEEQEEEIIKILEK